MNAPENDRCAACGGPGSLGCLLCWECQARQDAIDEPAGTVPEGDYDDIDDIDGDASAELAAKSDMSGESFAAYRERFGDAHTASIAMVLDGLQLGGRAK